MGKPPRGIGSLLSECGGQVILDKQWCETLWVLSQLNVTVSHNALFGLLLKKTKNHDCLVGQTLYILWSLISNKDKTKTSNIVSYQGYVVYRYLPISPIILLKELVFHVSFDPLNFFLYLFSTVISRLNLLNQICHRNKRKLTIDLLKSVFILLGS